MIPIFNELAASALESMIPLMNARKLKVIAAFFPKFITLSNFFSQKRWNKIKGFIPRKAPKGQPAPSGAFLRSAIFSVVLGSKILCGFKFD
jgi:hypothetical protein